MPFYLLRVDVAWKIVKINWRSACLSVAVFYYLHGFLIPNIHAHFIQSGVEFSSYSRSESVSPDSIVPLVKKTAGPG